MIRLFKPHPRFQRGITVRPRLLGSRQAATYVIANEACGLGRLTITQMCCVAVITIVSDQLHGHGKCFSQKPEVLRAIEAIVVISKDQSFDSLDIQYIAHLGRPHPAPPSRIDRCLGTRTAARGRKYDRRVKLWTRDIRHHQGHPATCRVSGKKDIVRRHAGRDQLVQCRVVSISRARAYIYDP